MLFFEVEEGRVEGQVIATAVARDGSWCSGSDATEEKADILLWYRVREYREDGTMKDIVYYNVETQDGRNNADEVLAQIEKDHPAGEWQNNDW